VRERFKPDRSLHSLKNCHSSLSFLPFVPNIGICVGLSWHIFVRLLSHYSQFCVVNNLFSSSSHAFSRKIASVMPLRQWLRGGRPNSQTTTQAFPIFRSRWILLVSLAIWLQLANAMTPARIAELRKETVDMFYHGFDNYMDIAFPEDEVGAHRLPRALKLANPKNS
jgi:hypothetical protein